MFSVINKGGSGGSEPLGTIPKEVSGIKVKKGNTKLTITWTDPEDSILPDGEVACRWAGTKVVYKEGAYPTNRYDGIQIMDNKVRNQYQSKGYELTNLKNGTTYYFAFFPYSETGLFNNSESQRIEGTPVLPPPYREYGVKIDYRNSNPETSCTYIGDAVDMIPGDFQGTWRETPIFANIKPCVLKDGVVQYYLNRDNLTLKEDGSPSVLTGEDGDVMVEVPKLGYKLQTSADGNTLEVWVTNEPNKDGYCYKAHSLNTEGDCDKIYVGAFLGNYKLHSYSGTNQTSQASMNEFRSIAKSFNTSIVKQIGEYQQFSFYPMTLIQCLYLMQYKNLNSQEAIGKGYWGDDSDCNTGITKTQKENYGAASDTVHMKFLNIEDLWGCFSVWVDGLCSDDNYNIKTDFNNFNDNGDNYRYITKTGFSRDVYGYIGTVQGNENGGFIIEKGTGYGTSQTTFFCDYGNLNRNCVAEFGGESGVSIIGPNSESIGIFCLRLFRDPTLVVLKRLGARLIFKHKEV